MGQPYCNFTEAIGNPVIIQGQYIVSQPSDKFLHEYCQLLQIAYICQKIADTVWSFARVCWLLLKWYQITAKVIF